MSTYGYTPYWLDAFPEGQKNLWSSHKMWKDDMESLASYAMLTAFFDNSIEQIEQRRNLLFHYLLGPFEANKSDDALAMFRRTLPVTTFMPKVVNNLCIAYNQAPSRTWLNGEKPEDTGTTLLRQIYKQMRADGRLQANYRYSKLTSGTAVGVYVGRNGRLQVEILTPDLFRYITPTLFPDQLTYFTRPLIEQKGEKTRTVFQVWTDTEMYYTDCEGEETDYWNPDREAYEGKITNPYGRVPYIVSRLVEPNTLQTFGAGLFDVVEANIVANAVQWLAGSSVMYEGFGHWVGINLGIGADGNFKMGLGKGTFADGVQGGGNPDALVEPSLSNISSNGQYDRMAEFLDSYVERVQRSIGLPQSVYSKNSGAPPSGIARKLERLELLEQRDSDIDLLKLFEQEFSDLVTVVYNTDVAKPMNKQAIPEGLTCQVEFVEEGIINEPAARFDMNLKALLAGVMLPSRFVREEAGKEVATEEEAVKYILDNQTLLEPIRSGLNGGTPKAATETTNSAATVEPVAPQQANGSIPDAEAVADAQEETEV